MSSDDELGLDICGLGRCHPTRGAPKPFDEINDRLLSPEHANLSDAGIFLDQVRSEGLRQWNMVDPDVQEGIDFITYTHSRPDGGETRGVDTVDMVYMCWTVSGDKPGAQDEPN